MCCTQCGRQAGRCHAVCAPSCVVLSLCCWGVGCPVLSRGGRQSGAGYRQGGIVRDAAHLLVPASLRLSRVEIPLVKVKLQVGHGLSSVHVCAVSCEWARGHVHGFMSAGDPKWLRAPRAHHAAAAAPTSTALTGGAPRARAAVACGVRTSPRLRAPISHPSPGSQCPAPNVLALRTRSCEIQLPNARCDV